MQTITTQHINLFKHQDITEKVLNSAGIATQSIRFNTRRGKWSLITLLTGTTGDQLTQSMAMFGLFEHDTLGDMTDFVVAYFDWYSSENIWRELDGTYDDLKTALFDLDIVEW